MRFVFALRDESNYKSFVLIRMLDYFDLYASNGLACRFYVPIAQSLRPLLWTIYGPNFPNLINAMLITFALHTPDYDSSLSICKGSESFAPGRSQFSFFALGVLFFEVPPLVFHNWFGASVY